MAIVTQNNQAAGGGAQSGLMTTVVPFTAAAHEHTELGFDVTVQPGTNSIELGPFDIPSYGYYRHFLLQVETVEKGELEAESKAHADAPWNLFSSVQVADVNGANIFGPLDGYATLWTSITGGYAGRPDPRVMPFYKSAITEPQFLLRIPQEVSRRDGFGSLANQSTNANYKVFLTLRAKDGLLAEGEWKKAPKLRIRGFLEAWSLPNPTDILGRPQQDAPPMLDSSQFYSQFRRDTQAGANTVLMTRVGSLIRNIIVIARDTNGDRSDEVFPDPIALEWDARRMRTDTQVMLTEHLTASVPELATRDAGVFAYLLDRSNKGTVGDDAPTFWYPTSQSTRLEIQGTTKKAGTWQIITNDVAPVSVTPQERYVERGRTGFHPETAGVQYGARG